MILDPLTAIFYAAVLASVTLITVRRPIYGVAALIVVQPFALYEYVSSTTITLPKIALIGVVLGLLAYRNAFSVVGERAPWRILWAGLLVTAATLLSLFHAIHHDAVFRETLKIVEYVVLFCAVVAAYRLDPDRSAVRTAVLTVAIAVALLALAQEIVGSPSGIYLNGHPVPRIAGPLEGPNQLAGYFDVVLPLTLAFAIDEPSLLANLALFLIVCADILTFSRSGILGACAGVFTVAFIARRGLRAPLRAMGAGLCAGLAAALSWGVVVHTLGIAHFGNFEESNYAGGVGTRSELWRAAWTLWKEHPIFGVGAGNFELDIPLTGLQGVRTHANSLYLQSLVEGGIFLFAATLWLVYTSIATFARDQMRSPLILGAFAASIALALHQITDLLVFYPKVGGMWWIAMALGAAEVAAVVYTRQPACA